MSIINKRPMDFLLFLLFLQFIFCLTVFFNIPVSRQVIGFLYLTFIPGYIVLKLLKLNNLSMLQSVLFSIGLSIALLMLLGLIVNEFGMLVGFSNMLSSLPLMLFLNVFMLVTELIIYLRNGNSKLFDFKTFRITPLVLLLLCLPVLSVIGAIWVNVFDSNLILLCVIPTMVALIALSIVSKKFLAPKFYALALLSVALALLFHSSLISTYIHGFDMPLEYHVFVLTQDNGFWNQAAYLNDITYSRFNGMLSITVLPTLYSNILNIDGTWVFILIFPLIFSFVPLGLYELWQTNFDKKTALAASFLFVSQLTFYTDMVTLARQMIAEIFLVLLFLLVISKRLENTVGAKICFVIFSFGLVVSHYALALIFLFFILIAWIFSSLIKRKPSGLSLSLLLLFSGITFVWYIFTSGSASFESILSFGSQVFRNLGEFFNPASRGSAVMQAVGLEAPQSYWGLLSRIFAYATEFFISVGFVVVVLRSWRAKFTRSLNQTYFVLTLVAMIILAMCILLPTFASTLGMTRFYHITLFFLAPLFVLGCEALASFLAKRRLPLVVSLLVAIVIVPYFLFQTNFVYEVTGSESWSVPLSKYRMDKVFIYSWGYMEEQSVIGAEWLSRHANTSNVQLYADSLSRYKELRSYGGIYSGYINTLSNTTVFPFNSIVYLSQLNVVYGKIVGQVFVWNSSEFDILFVNMNKVYTNGGSEIYMTVPGS
jgi:uncharacterized membrane protein